MEEKTKEQQDAATIKALTIALQEACSSLSAITNLAGKVETLKDFSQIRGYAQNRAAVARAALAMVKE